MKGWPLLLCALLPAVPGAPLEAQEIVLRVPVTGTIELGLAPFIARSIREANEERHAAVVLDIDTFGGRVDAAQKIVTAITASEIPVYVIISHNAWSAGAMIALAADSIYMTPGSSIGAATPVDGSGTKSSEKIVSAMRGEFRALAERRGLDPRIAEAMVDEEIAIEGVVEAGKLLTLTGQEAVDLGVAEAVVENLEEMLGRVGLEDVQVEQASINWAESLVRFLSNPLVAPILLSLGTIGLLIEIKTPTFGVAGLVGLTALGAFFGSHLIVGLAGWEEFILLGVGIVALVIEVFVVPGFGIAGIVAIICIGSATFMALIGALPTWSDVTRASGILVVAATIVGVVIAAVVRHMPTRSRWRGIFLSESTNRAAGYVAGPARDDLIGAIGVALTDLRPSGTVQVGDERVDVVSDVGFISKGSTIRVIRSEGYRHVVELADDSAQV